MTEKFVVFNPGKGTVSFSVYPTVDLPDEMSRHKKRRVYKSSSIQVIVPTQSSVDLVEKTGMSVAELKEQTELLHMLHDRIPKLFLKGEEVTKPKKEVAPAPKAPKEEKKVEEKTPPPKPEPEPEPEPTPSPSKKKKTRKK